MDELIDELTSQIRKDSIQRGDFGTQEEVKAYNEFRQKQADIISAKNFEIK